MLAILAAATPNTMHQRSTIIGLLWPDLDEAHARNALSKALHHLRRSLGEEAVVSRGPEDVGLSDEHVWSDLAAFHFALDRGDDAAALELYGRGVLLDGFVLADTPEFDQWLDRTRAILRERAVRAATRLSSGAEALGDLAGAAEWARRAVRIEPYDEIGVRRLLTLLDQAGDRAGALAVYQDFAVRLQAELEADPSPETRALAQAIRARSGSVAPTAPTTLNTTSPTAAPVWPGAVAMAPEPTPSLLASRLQLVTKYRRWAGVAVVLSLVAVAASTLPTARDTRIDDARVLVASFENRTGDPALDPLGEMAQDWVTQGLQQTGLANVVDPLSAVLASREIAGDSGQLSGVMRASAMARSSGARIVVWGTMYRRGDSLQLRAQITDSRDDRLVMTLDPVVASLDQPLEAADQLRSQVAGAVASLLDEQLASITTSSSRPPNLEAYREYMLGLMHFQGFRYAEALSHFERAALLDSSFALPLIWSAFAFGNSSRNAERDSVIEMLVARRDHLSPLDRYATDYFVAHQRGDRYAALAATREAARLSPGSNWSHNAGVIAVQLNRLHEALHHLNQIDPQHGWAKQWGSYWILLTHSYHHVGEYERELESALRLRAQAPEGQLGAWLEVFALVALGRVGEAMKGADEAVLLESDPTFVAGYGLAFAALEMDAHGHPEPARTLRERAIDWARSPHAEAWIELRPQVEHRRRRLLVLRTLGEALYAASRLEESKEVWQNVSTEDSANIYARTHLGLIAARLGQHEKAEGAIEWLTARGQPYSAGRIATVLGDRKRALGLASRAQFAEDFDGLHQHTEWEALRQDPEFQAIVRPRGQRLRKVRLDARESAGEAVGSAAHMRARCELRTMASGSENLAIRRVERCVSNSPLGVAALFAISPSLSDAKSAVSLNRGCIAQFTSLGAAARGPEAAHAKLDHPPSAPILPPPARPGRYPSALRRPRTGP